MTTATQSTSSPATASALQQTVGKQLHSSPVVAAAIRTMVEELKTRSATITDAKAGEPALKADYDALMARAAAVRGRPLLYPFVGSGIGNGPLVELCDGSVKWDMICGIGVHFFGHSDPDLAEAALKSGLDDTVKHGNLVSNFEAYSFAEVLLNEAKRNSKLKHAYIATSGAMANENALKVCMQKTGGTRVIAFKDCFMGRSLTMLAVGDSHAGREGLPINTHVDYMPFYDQVVVDRMGKKRFIDMALMHLEQYLTRYPGQHSCKRFAHGNSKQCAYAAY